MKEVSNRTLVMLVTVAIVVSVLGTFVSLQRLSNFESITGRLATTDLGTVSVEVPSNAYINVTDNNINFTNMSVGDSNASDNLALGPDFFTVRNDGSVLVNVTAYLSSNESLFSSSTNAGCLGTGTDGNALDDSRCIFIRCYNSTAGYDNCSLGFTQINNSIGAAHLNLTNHLPIGGTVNLSINLTIPTDEPSGLKSGTIVVVGSSAT